MQKLFNFTLTHDSRGIFWCFGRCFNQLCNQLKITVHFRCCHFIHVLTFFLRELPLHGRERLCKHSCNSPCPDYSRLCGKILRFRFDETFFSGITPQGGEKSDVFRVRVAGEGSPPRGRGKGDTNYKIPRFFGITPAWAGKSFCRHSHVIQNADHPRVGGEKPSTYQVEYWALGSPPRGRGKDERRRPGEIRARITPAWAGKSWPLRDIHNLVWDHPRVGGEKFVRYGYKFPVGGSPPRGRGKVPETYRYVAGYGITPAWAGKSLGICACFPLVQDHPRVGGEKGNRPIRKFYGLGSPPRGRGKASFRSGCRSVSRITPAWAGKRLKRSHRSGIFISGPIPFHSVLHRPAGSGGSRAGRDGSPAGQPQNTGPA